MQCLHHFPKNRDTIFEIFILIDFLVLKSRFLFPNFKNPLKSNSVIAYITVQSIFVRYSREFVIIMNIYHEHFCSEENLWDWWGGIFFWCAPFRCLYFLSFHIQSNLCTTTTPGTQNVWPLLTGGRCSEVGLYYKNGKWDPKMVVAIGRWSLFGGGR